MHHYYVVLLSGGELRSYQTFNKHPNPRSAYDEVRMRDAEEYPDNHCVAPDATIIRKGGYGDPFEMYKD